MFIHQAIRTVPTIVLLLQIWNGRLAMIAFATLLIVEGFKAGPGLVFGGGAPPTL
jgi:hypothetical protein